MSNTTHPVRTFYQALRIAAKLERTSKGFIRADGCTCSGLPCTGILVSNEYGTDILTWDSFVHLWLQNRECDERFITKPFLARKK